MTDERHARAAANNARWCDSVCRAQGTPGEFRRHLWLNRSAVPRFYPNVITLEASDPAQLEASLADTGVEVLSDRVPGRNALTTIIPIHGTLNRPKLDVWTAVTGVLRNAFVVGLRETLQQLPPPKDTGGMAATVAHP